MVLHNNLRSYLFMREVMLLLVIVVHLWLIVMLVNGGEMVKGKILDRLMINIGSLVLYDVLINMGSLVLYALLINMGSLVLYAVLINMGGMGLNIVVIIIRYVLPNTVLIIMSGVVLGYVMSVIMSVFFVHFDLSHILMRVATLVIEVTGMVRVLEVVLLAVERQRLVRDVGVLSFMFQRRLNVVEELIINMLNVVLDLATLVVVYVMRVGVTSVIWVISSVMSEVFVRLVVVIVVIASENGRACVVIRRHFGFVLTFVVGIAVSIKVLVTSVTVFVSKGTVVFKCTKVTTLHHVTMINKLSMRIMVTEMHLVRAKVGVGVFKRIVADMLSQLVGILMLGRLVSEPTMLVGIDKLVIGWQDLHRLFNRKHSMNSTMVILNVLISHKRWLSHLADFVVNLRGEVL